MMSTLIVSVILHLRDLFFNSFQISSNDAAISVTYLCLLLFNLKNTAANRQYSTHVLYTVSSLHLK